MDLSALRDSIADAGMAKFRQFGIRRVTMDDIARELRISKKTIYRVFPDKGALVDACVDRVIQQVLPGGEAALQAEGSVIERLDGLLAFVARVPQLISPPFVGDLRSDYPQLWERVDARRRRVFAHIESLLVEGRASGEVRPEIHPRVAQLVLFAILDRVLVPEVMLSGEFSLAEAIATVGTMFTRGALVHGRVRQRARPTRAGDRARASRVALKEARR